MVAHIPYLATVPKYHVVAREVATMEFLRSSWLPVPQMYGYSPASDNAVETEYIFMKCMRGTKLSDVWLELGGIGYRFNLAPTCSTRVSNNVDLFPRWRKSLLRPRPGEGGQEGGHPARGRAFLRWSACFVVWQKIIARRRPGTVYAAFCVFDYALELTDYCRRKRKSGTHSSSHKELAYLAQFGQPLLPFRRERKDCYQYQE